MRLAIVGKKEREGKSKLKNVMGIIEQEVNGCKNDA